MTQEELMLGDWVIRKNVPDEKLTVVAINLITKLVALDLDGRGVIEDIYNIRPIPLTPEILEKNGFVKYNEVSDTPPYDKDEEGNMYYSYKGEHKFWGWWQPNNVYYIPINAMIDLEIKFVHELQRALRMCGITKEIKI